jgi:hypothetical protein
MGLDMYLSARRYLSKYDENDKVLRTEVTALVEGIATEWEVKEVNYEVGYWRKANAIHEWFVQNVQGGEDDCKEYYVTKENIIELYDTVVEVLNDRTKAADLLPPQEGFFFGPTDIDDWYFEDLETTKKILQPIVDRINDPEKVKELNLFDFYYRASW